MYPTSIGYKIKCWIQILMVAAVVAATVYLAVKKYNDHQEKVRRKQEAVAASKVVTVPVPDAVLKPAESLDLEIVTDRRRKTNSDQKADAVRKELTAKLKQEREAFARALQALKERQDQLLADKCKTSN